ncbi:MAG: NuoM family protein [Phycisphaerales bacterium]
MLLASLILAPLATALLIAIAPERLAKHIAAMGSLVALALTAAAMNAFDWAAPGLHQFASSYPLIDTLGIRLSIGVDSVALWLIALTGFLGPLCVYGSFTAIDTRRKTFYASLLALQGVMVGVFAARDLLLFYICFEFTLLPMYVLINLFGSTNRHAAAIKFFLYTFTGSIITLAALVWVAAQAAAGRDGLWSFDIGMLQSFAAASLSPSEQAWVLLAMMCGFAVKVPLFPVHTWLPLAHTEAPTAGSVILAGVLLKLGTYAMFRFVLPFVPEAVVEYAPFIGVLSIVGILYGGLICWVQRDVKKLVAYSSVAHLGFCVLGLFALNTVGAAGSILYMINHGLSTGALFFCIGFMYERYHTRSLDEVGGLASKMPVWAFFMVFFTMASVGLPGLNGFISEFMCLMGTFQSGAASSGAVGIGAAPGVFGPWYAAVAGVGMIVAAMYLLYMVGKIVFGPLKEPHGHGHGGGHGGGHGHDDKDDHAHGTLPADLTFREISVLTPLAVACVVLGLFPTPVIRTLENPINLTLKPAQNVLVERGRVDLRKTLSAESGSVGSPSRLAESTPTPESATTTPVNEGAAQ